MDMMLVFFLLLLGTIGSVSIRCDNVRDCQRFNTFCHGPYVCNQSAWCSPQNVAYDPCHQLRVQALSFSRDSRGEHIVSILCMEELRQCVELYYCVRDEDCDDGLFCNGQERCVQGQCYGAATTTTTTTVCKVCDESTRCGTAFVATTTTTTTNTTPADTTTVYTIVGISLIVVALVMLFVLILIFRSVEKVY